VNNYTLKQAAVEAAPSSAVLASAALDTLNNTALLSSLDPWMKGAGLVFLVLQIAYMLWRWRRDIRRDRADEQDSK
jgi:membrane protein implicated in regulation of membrane protease activity